MVYNIYNKQSFPRPRGIAASLDQEDDQGKWVPVDHTSRAMSAYKQGRASQIDWESLAKTWGKMMFRPYLGGVYFTSWGDHKPLMPLYNEMTKTAPGRGARHSNKPTQSSARMTSRTTRTKSGPRPRPRAGSRTRAGPAEAASSLAGTALSSWRTPGPTGHRAPGRLQLKNTLY